MLETKNNMVVTGGCGFIGAHLIRNTSVKYDRITIIDSMEFGSHQRLPKTSSTEIVVVDKSILDVTTNEYDEIISEGDVVIHLAAQKLHNPGADFEKVISENILGSQKVFEAATRNKARLVVNSSSLYAYPQSSLKPFSEKDRPEPFTGYGISKVTSEWLLETTTKNTSTIPVNLRFFFVYGPMQYMGAGYPSVIVKSMERIKRGQKPLVNGSGDQKLDYIYVGDVIRLIDAVCLNENPAGTFNVSSGTPVSINRLVDYITSITGFTGGIEYTAADWTDGTNRHGDNNLACQRFDWEPLVGLKDGLIKTWDWISEDV